MSVRIAGLAAVVLLTLGSGLGQGAVDSPNSESAIRAVLARQVNAWNHHDVEAFMAGYWHSPELTFFSGATETKGWEPTLARYRQKYQSNGADMGTLEMTDLRVVVLATNSAFVRGRWRLTMPDGKQLNGLFTLLFRKFPNGWQIVHDHTSAAP